MEMNIEQYRNGYIFVNSKQTICNSVTFVSMPYGYHEDMQATGLPARDTGMHTNT